MDDLEGIGQVGGEQLLGQAGLARADGAAGRAADDQALFFGRGGGVVEKRGERDVERPGKEPQIGDRGGGEAAFDLGEPADRPAGCPGEVGQPQAARLAERAQVIAQRCRAVGAGVVQGGLGVA